MKQLLFTIIAICILSFVANAQLRAYTFSYTDEFSAKQSCYLTLRSIVAEWDSAALNVLFNCNESADTRTKGIPAKKVFVMALKGDDFIANVIKTVDDSDKGKPRAVVLSNWAWDIALTYKFLDDYSYDGTKKQMVSTKKSLTDLAAKRVDIPLDSLAIK